MVTGPAIASAVVGWRLTWRDEAQLHDLLGDVFTGHGFTVLHEVRLEGARGGRIDFVIGRVGVEVKIKGSAADVARQLQRYAHSDRLRELALVTSVARHRELPTSIGGKPLTVIPIGCVA